MSNAAVGVLYLIAAGLALLTGLGLSILVCIFGSVIAGTRARRKGHTVVSIGVITVLGGGASVVAFLAALLIGSERLPAWQVLPLVFASPIVMPVTMLLVAWLLPRRTVRIFGRRRGGRWLIVAGRIIGITLSVAATVGVLVVTWSEIDSWTAMAMVALMVALAGVIGATPWYIMTRFGRNAERQPTLEEVLARDPRPPVLFVRPFDGERRPFVLGDYDRYARFFRGYGQPQKGDAVRITLEVYLAASLRRQIGPLVALGSPEDFTHPVSGAVRKYASDEDWQQEFEELAASAAAILVDAGNSANLRWEFEHILRRGRHDRLILLTSHPTRFSRHATFWRRLERLMGISTPTWPELAAMLRRAGYDVAPDDPGPGSIVAFDAQARSVVLTTQADLPEDYVDAIRQHVAGKTERTAPAAIKTRVDIV